MKLSGAERPAMVLKQARINASYAKRAVMSGRHDDAFAWARAAVRLAKSLEEKQ